ncbi:thiamine pyrophosphate-binding protein [Jiangella mangrovi]|uniref:Acetolactate synthase-1/2/3 large subunit n=1 Tax=Jiangella mangrovi TaxID=1524084 RepID=A0A7W9GP92_9ACTN|nr:thiamine pyrophosphate-binding protein [Jiangella mangrovi]MBB5787246.1 acetolactate synthase-1/2/3 large subunit [Jiangella mangrovi]
MPATPLLDTDVPTTEAVVRVLREAGVDTVFGLSGGDTGRIFSRLAHHVDGVRTVLVRNESHATSAAEAYARVSGRLGVAMAQGSWLVGQGLVGILEAQASGTPMLLLGDLTDGRPYSQHAPYQAGTADYGTWDAPAAFRSVTKRVFVATTPAEAVQSVQLGIKHALAGQPGPVAVLFSSASLAGTVGPGSLPRLYATQAYLTRQPAPAPDVSELAQALATASAPVLLAGGGVRLARAEAVLREVAEATGAAVVTSPAGKGTFPEDHPGSGGVFGTFGSPVANDALGRADLVLVLGSKLGPSDTAAESPGLIDPARQRIVHVDIEPLNAAWTMPTADVIVADVAATLGALADELAAHPVDTGIVTARQNALAALRAEASTPGAEDAAAANGGSPVHPRRVIAELRAALPDDAVVCADAGENRLLMSRYFESRSGGTYLQPAGAGGMGYSIPAAIGAKVFAPERTVLAVCGDGGFSMSLPALLTATEENAPIVVVVFDNGTLGWVRHSQRMRGEQEFNSNLRRFDYAGIAAAAGFAAFRAGKPDELPGALADAVAAADRAEAPAIVVVDVSTEQTFVDLRTPLMAAAAPAPAARS